MQNFAVFVLVMLALIGGIFAGMITFSPNQENINKAIINYCHDTNQLACANQCQQLNNNLCQQVNLLIQNP